MAKPARLIVRRLLNPRTRRHFLEKLGWIVVGFPRLVAALFDFRVKELFVVRLLHPYLLMLMLCGRRDLSRSLLLYGIHFSPHAKKGRLRFPCRAVCESDIKPYRVLGLLLAIRNKLSPFERIYLADWPDGASNLLKGREHFLFHEGSAGTLAVTSALSGRNSDIKGYILSDAHPNIEGVPVQKLDLPRLIPKRFKLLEWAFPELGSAKREIATIRRGPKKLALLFSQPNHMDYGPCSPEQNREIYRAIVGTLFAHGYEVILKPHPREMLSEARKYRPVGSAGKLWVVGGFYPGEVLAALLPEALLVTIYSTSVQVMSGSVGRKFIILGSKWLSKRLNRLEGAFKTGFSASRNLDKRLAQALKELPIKNPH